MTDFFSLDTVSPTVPAHAQSRELKETIFYPDHVKRGAESHEFQETKTAEEAAGEGCFICGVTQAELGSNVRMEGHHYNVEFSLINSLDLAKVQKYFPGVTDLKTFLDSPANLILLCPRHHRSPLRGVHMVTHPAWVAQRLQKDGWDLVTGTNPAEEIEDLSTYYPEH
jgi:hypothetical protein